MKIQKITNKFTSYLEGNDYIVDLGFVNRGDDTSVILSINGVEDTNLLTIHPRCGCTASNQENKETEVLVTLRYKDCDPTFSKVVEVRYSNIVIGLIKIRGRCQ